MDVNYRGVADRLKPGKGQELPQWAMFGPKRYFPGSYLHPKVDVLKLLAIEKMQEVAVEETNDDRLLRRSKKIIDDVMLQGLKAVSANIARNERMDIVRNELERQIKHSVVVRFMQRAAYTADRRALGLV